MQMNQCMRTTLLLDDEVIAKAGELTGIDEKTKLLHMGLEALIHRESSRRLAALGGTVADLGIAPRRKAGFKHTAKGGQPALKVAEKSARHGSRRHKRVG